MQIRQLFSRPPLSGQHLTLLERATAFLASIAFAVLPPLALLILAG